MYWHHILNVDKNEILYKIYRKQVTTYTKGKDYRNTGYDTGPISCKYDQTSFFFRLR